MTAPAPQSDRRPLASRNLLVMQRLAAVLARAGVSPNAISLASLVVGILGGVALAATVRVEGGLALRLLYRPGWTRIVQQVEAAVRRLGGVAAEAPMADPPSPA